ncbi:hypothetical protein QBC46DRAFT_397028 [Diplogelasinospora grovesii]|uniref:Cardiolipin synthase N-terminal domain-containing protein n=1 Tax=Diplogelasinospora grovesii TaxID=303347 RepID=A0AAN6MZ47_9PEZI|nr:hypothetical protein QBC46DRAFT_397028 [Diplogelasinospora grovesii]
MFPKIITFCIIITSPAKSERIIASMLSNALISNFILQFCLASLAFALPFADETLATRSEGVAAVVHENSWQFGTGGGILGLVVLILDILVFIEVFKSNRPPSSKLLWCLLVFFFPIIGMLIYWLFSNRTAHKSGAGYEPVA